MPKRVDLFDSTYGHFSERVLRAIREETFGTDIGQNSWLTADEYDRLIVPLGLSPTDHVLEIACGSGGPARYLARTTGCRVTGIDANEAGIATARKLAAEAGDERVAFSVADATARLPFDDASFDGLVCIDSMNHFPNRLEVLKEWCRVLRPKGRALFTDPVVISGPVTNDELALRSSIGLFVFVPEGFNEKLIDGAGFELVSTEDVSPNCASVALRWNRARLAHKDELIPMEGEERFTGLQTFFQAVHDLTAQRRLSRIAYLVQKPRPR